MIELQTLCAELELDDDRVRDALLRERRQESSTLAMPWYVRLVVGVSAWITALVAVGLGAAILVIGLETDSGVMFSSTGIIFFCIGWLLLRSVRGGVYLAQLGLAVAAAGVALFTFGAGLQFEEIWAATLASALATAVTIAITPNRTLQFLAALLTAILFCTALLDHQVTYYLDIVSVVGLAGFVLMLRPPQHDLQPLAFVLLLLFPSVAILDPKSFAYTLESWKVGGTFAQGLHIGLFLWFVFIHWQRASTPEARERLAPFAAAAVAVCLLLPPGGSAALAIMMLAFVLGSRPLALLGTLLQIHYIWRFYYDLDITLLGKSGVLSSVGVVLLVAWWLMQRRSSEGVRA